VLEVAAEGSFELLVPKLVLAELKRVLVEKLHVEAPVRANLIALLDEIPVVHLPTPRSAEARSGDPSDDRILAAAIAGGADLLVSGDRRHLLPLREVEGMPIERPQDFLARLTG
jgi:predicted nucleic acid-binding protein